METADNLQTEFMWTDGRAATKSDKVKHSNISELFKVFGKYWPILEPTFIPRLMKLNIV